MKAVKLFVLACLAVLVASCGGGSNTKDLKIDTTIGGDQTGARAYSELFEVVDTAAVYTLEKVSKEDSGKAFDDQNWSIAVRINVKNDAFKGIVPSEIEKNIPTLTLEVLNTEGKEILGQSGYKLEGDNLKNFLEMLSKGAGTQGTIVFTQQTNNSKDCDKWFNEEAASVRLISGSLNGSIPLKNSSDSESSSIKGYDGTDREGVDVSDYNEAMMGSSYMDVADMGSSPEASSYEASASEASAPEVGLYEF